jgi:hypothetical protein
VLKLRFDTSTARSVKLVIYERICTAVGFMMVGLLATPPLFLLEVPPLLVIVPLSLWLGGLVMLAAIPCAGKPPYLDWLCEDSANPWGASTVGRLRGRRIAGVAAGGATVAHASVDAKGGAGRALFQPSSDRSPHEMSLWIIFIRAAVSWQSA